MAIVKMEKISICAKRKDRKKLLETLQRMGAVEIFDSDIEDEFFSTVDTSKSMRVFEENAKIADEAANILNHYLQGKEEKVTSLTGKKAINVENYYKFVENEAEIMRVAYTLCDASKSIAEKKSEIIRATLKQENLKPWLALDISMRFKGTKSTTAFIGTILGDNSFEDVLAKFANLAPNVENIAVEIISKNIDTTCIFVICKKKDQREVEAALKNMGFAYPPNKNKRTPQEKFSKLSQKISDLNEEIEDYEKLIKSYAGVLHALRFIVDYYSIRSEKYSIISKLRHTKHVFLLTGFIPKYREREIEKVLTENFDTAIEFSEPEDENAPVLLKNSSFAKPVEPVLESYSLPGKGEVDPTSVMAVFYYILFGLMLSDAAYGIIMVLGCLFILFKFKNMEDNFKKTFKMFLYCGISTTFWGVLFGSYFGDAVEVISQTFFQRKVTIPPLWFTPLNEPIKMLTYSFGLGIVHLFAGLFLKLYQLFKAKKYKDIFYDVISWYLLVGGCIIYLLSVPMITNLLTLDFVLSGNVANIALICIIVGIVCIVLTSGRESKSPFKRLLKGLYGLYGITGYLSDIFSYSRLLALGLATGVIAQVFNKMGVMAGPGPLGIIVFVIVFVVGHAMNIAINLLGAYVHTNRLQFVEFFSKFYEGGGKKFSPFSVNTKYYKIKEDISNG